MKRRFQLGAAVATLAFVILASSADARADAADLCLVPMKNGIPTEADEGRAWRMVREATVIPQIPRIFFHGLNRGGAWTVDRELTYAPTADLFPSRWHYLVEPATNRIVGLGVGRVLVASPGDERFQIVDNPLPQLVFRSLAYVPRLGRTVFATTKGLLALNGDRLVPMPGGGEKELGAIDSIFDLPHSGAIAFTQGARVLLRRDDGAVIEIYRMKKPWSGEEYAQTITELPFGRILIVAGHSLAVVQTVLRDGKVEVESQHSLLSYEGRRGTDNSRDFVSAATESYLIYGRTLKGRSTTRGGRDIPMRSDDARFNFLEKLEGREFVAVPGGDFRAYLPWMKDVPSLKLVLIDTAAGMVAFDGQRVTAIPGGESFSAGYTREYPSRGKVLSRSRLAIAELTAERRMRRIALPFDTNVNPLLDVAELPESELVILIAQHGVFAMDRDEKIFQVRGADRYSPLASGGIVAVIPGRGEMVLAGAEQLFVLADRRRLPGACDGIPD